MPTVNLGRVRPIYKGNYSAGTTYQPLDFVRHGNLLYICKQTSVGNVPTNTSYFDVVTDEGNAVPAPNLIPKSRSDGTLDPRWLGFGPDAAREMLLREATLRANFADNEYWLYEGLGGMARKSFSDVFTFERASDATGLTATGQLETVGSNVPRLVGNREGLLIEESRTNLLLNSDAPVTQSVTVTNGTVYTLSVYGSGSASITTGGSGTATEGSPLAFTSTGTTVEVTVSGSLDRFQLEEGPSATSFILTAGSQVTRAAEPFYRTLGNEFKATEGTIVVSCSVIASSPFSGSGQIVGVGGGGPFFSLSQTNFGALRCFVDVGGGTEIRFSEIGYPNNGQLRNYALAFKDGLLSVAVDGAVIHTDAVVPLSISGRMALYGIYASTQISPPSKKILADLAYIPRALTEAELITLTTPEAA